MLVDVGGAVSFAEILPPGEYTSPPRSRPPTLAKLTLDPGSVRTNAPAAKSSTPYVTCSGGTLGSLRGAVTPKDSDVGARSPSSGVLRVEKPCTTPPVAVS